MSTKREATSREGSSAVKSSVGNSDHDPCILGIGIVVVGGLSGLCSAGELIATPPGKAVVIEVSGVDEL